MKAAPKAVSLSICAALLGACSGGSGAPDAASNSGSSGSLAVVQIERWGQSDDAASHVLSQAKIARFEGADGDGVERLLGEHGVELEACALASEQSFGLSDGLAVELLDVGSIALALGGATQTLAPRVFPLVAGAAHGVFYVANAELPQPRAELDEYVISAPGAGGVGAFEVALPAPGAVAGVSLGGRDADAGEPLMLPRDDDFDLTWVASDPRDRVELELAAGGDVLTCVARDDGHFTLPKGQLVALPRDAEAQLTVRRVRLLPFDMQGIEVAYVRAVSASVLPLVVE